jgi:hypothetical protein
MRINLEDLATLGNGYSGFVSNCLQGISVKDQLCGPNRFDSATPVSEHTNTYVLKKKTSYYLMFVQQDAVYNEIVACLARPSNAERNKSQTNTWIVETATGGYSIYRSRIPPVPGCILDSSGMRINYPPSAVAFFESFYPELGGDLRNNGFSVPTEKTGLE